MTTHGAAALPHLVRNARVLIVEDEPRMREMLQRASAEMGFESASAGSAEQALRILDRPQTAEQPPDIVLLDLNLPGMGGLELLDQLRQRLPSAAVIVLTGFGSLDAAKVAIRHGVVDFLTKPCRLDELEAALARARERHRQAPPQDVPAPTSTLAAPAPTTTLEELERLHIEAALDRHDGNRSAAAAALGISERTLYYRLSRYARRPT
jgi:DNA-binding NtrC family response regulator